MNWDDDELASTAAARAAAVRRPVADRKTPERADRHGARTQDPRVSELRPAKPRTEKEPPANDFPEFRMRGPEPDWLPGMVRQLFLDGVQIEKARTTAQIVAAMAFEPKLGRPTKGPRIVAREKRSKDGRRVAYVMYRRRPISLGVVLKPKEVARKNPGAIAAYVRWVEEKCRAITQRLLARDWTLGGIFDWYIARYDPKAAGNSEPETTDDGEPETTSEGTPQLPFARRAGHIVSLRELLGELPFIDVKASTAERYVIDRCRTEIRRYKKTGPNGTRRRYMASTAVRHTDTLVHVLTLFCDDHGYDHKVVRRPKAPKEEPRWLTWDQLLRLLRACRGRVFDRAGKLVGRHDKRDRYVCIERLLWLLFYGGVREANGRYLTYGQQTNKPGRKPRGHLNPGGGRGNLQRQGPGARVTNKRRNTTTAFGSLEPLSVGWKQRDLATREALGAEAGMRYVNIIHDEKGYEVSRGAMDTRLAEVCELAGMDKIDSHSVKHTGVTIVSKAGMPLNLVERNYSTSVLSLVMTYRHLHEHWFDPRPEPYDPDKMFFLALRKHSPPSFEQVYGVAPPA
ncbi:hypothetical protein [Bradyrhizobium sp. CCBAU 53380]|uniref:hypothetical protein n=1 Tax=Bradyrhizobium sp. CCBAU 53380 TaxID=1325117 RepID=UPI002304C307|nr:hypothetical protein [Bradyrhizobium sp. CCBAU 53380]MDA9422917.1 hypothetical protein [Bradyrhizobium sp. CCBAU 53380]